MVISEKAADSLKAALKESGKGAVRFNFIGFG